MAAVLAVAISAGPERAPAQEGLNFDIAFDAAKPVECAAEVNGPWGDPAPVFRVMKSGAQQAVACVALLERSMPAWHQDPGAQELVAPFVAYLLGDGTAKGLQRHAIFIQLLGHLEKIAPDWRLRAPVEAMLPEIILGSGVEDPFVANFWATALPEIDQDWPESSAAKSILPVLYDLALEERKRSPAEPRNERPEALLKQISWSRYARLILAAEVFDTWPRRMLWIAVALLALFIAGRRLRRR